MVCGMTPSSAATTSTTTSVALAPRARMAVNAAWPGVSRNVIMPLRRLHVVRADVLRDAARLARRHLGAADVIEQRSLAVVDVAHDGDHGRTRQLRLGRVLSPCRSSSIWSSFSTLAMWPISSTTSIAVSWSMGWLIVAMTPMFIMRLDDFVGLDRHASARAPATVMVSPMVHFALDRRGGHFEAVLRFDARRCRCRRARLTRFFFLMRALTPPATCSSWRP